MYRSELTEKNDDNMQTKTLKKLKSLLRNSKLSSKFNSAECVAILHGPSVVIEAVVFTASEKSGIPMDWGYCGGRAAVYALGDATKARSALASALPGGDVNLGDL